MTLVSLWPVFVFWAVAIAGLRGDAVVLLYALFAGMPFASLAVVPVEYTGGLTLTPAPVISLLLVLQCLARPAGRRWFFHACMSFSHYGLLFLFWLVASFTTLFAPRFFAGEVEVIPVRAENLGETVLLGPTMQNFSQLGYISVSVFVVIAAGRLMLDPAVRAHVLRAMVLGATLLCITGGLDMLSGSIELAPVLEPLRTASYAIATDAQIRELDLRRVSGVTPEPSVFGSLCVMFLATLWFHRRVMQERWMRRVAPVLCATLAAMIWLSTSTTAYVGLAIVVAAGIAEAVWRAVRSRQRSVERRAALGETRRFVMLVVLVCGLFVVFPEVYARAAEVVDQMVFKKTESGSFEERSMWTAVSLQSAFDTYGVGVGLGGTRASNSFVAMLSNVGVLGTLLYLGFIAATYLRRPSRRVPDGPAWLTAYRWTVPTIIALGLMAGTTADFGPYLALLFGGSVALQEGRRMERLLERAALSPPHDEERRRRERRRRREGFWMPRGRGSRSRRAGGRSSSGAGRSGASAVSRSPGFLAVPAPMLDLGAPPSPAVPAAPVEKAAEEAMTEEADASGAERATRAPRTPRGHAPEETGSMLDIG